MAEYKNPAPPSLYAAPGPGPAPVPDRDPRPSPEPPLYGPPEGGDAGGTTSMVVSSPAIAGESGSAYDVNAGPVDAPYAPGSIDPIYVGGDLAGTVAGAVAAAEGRFHDREAETFGQGSVIGDVMTLPPSPLDPGVGSLGTTVPSGSFYDPPREY